MDWTNPFRHGPCYGPAFVTPRCANVLAGRVRRDRAGCPSLRAGHRGLPLTRKPLDRHEQCLSSPEWSTVPAAPPIRVPVALLDSLKRTKDQQFYAIGFISGDTAELRTLTAAGGGNYYNAANPRQLDSIYAALTGLLVHRKIDTSFSTRRIQIKPDTVRQPVDVLLAIDMSGSMSTMDGTLRWRIAWAKIAALGFLDSLESQDRVAVLGWTTTAYGNVYLADTANRNIYCKKWLPFTSNFDLVRTFIYDSLYVDNDGSNVYDTFGGRSMVISGEIAGGSFGNTPLRISSVLAMSYLSKLGRPGANKVVIMCTDGVNNDGETRSATVAFIDSLRRTQGLQMYTVGFVQGDTTELRALAVAGGGTFYNANDNIALQNAYASLAHQLVMEKLAARKLLIQEVLQTPPLYYITGTQTATANCTVPLESFQSLKDSRGNTVLRWQFKTIPIWGCAEVYYTIVAINGANTVIGVDSAHAGGGFYSQMVYTDNDYNSVTVNIPASGSPMVGIVQKGAAPSAFSYSFRPDGAVRIRLPGPSSVSLTLYNLSGRIVYRTAAMPSSPEHSISFAIPKSVPPGIYAACCTYNNTVLRATVHLIE